MSAISPKIDTCTAARAAEIDSLQKGWTSSGDQARIHDLFMAARGKDLTELKRAVDLGQDPRDLERLLYGDISNKKIRQRIETHIAQEAKASGPTGQLKVFSDIDDTLYANWADKRFPKGTLYPGVLQFYRELDSGTGATPDAPGDLVFLTARPGTALGVVEQMTHKTLSQKGVQQATVLTGDFFNWLGHQRMASKKVQNFDRMMKLYPEFGAVFVGDSGQGDALAAMEMLKRPNMRGAFIHNIGNITPAQQHEYAHKGIVVFETYVDAALAAFKRGLITQHGLWRVVDAAKLDLAQVSFANTTQKAAAYAAQDRALQALGRIGRN